MVLQIISHAVNDQTHDIRQVVEGLDTKALDEVLGDFETEASKTYPPSAY